MRQNTYLEDLRKRETLVVPHSRKGAQLRGKIARSELYGLFLRQQNGRVCYVHKQMMAMITESHARVDRPKGQIAMQRDTVCAPQIFDDQH